MEISENKKRKYSVPAIENTFKILRLLSRKQFRESTLTEIANALSLNTATCYRLLQQLEELAIVRYKAKDKRYTLGPYLIVLGDRAKEHLDYVSMIRPYLKVLAKNTGLTSVLVSRVGKDKLTILSKVEGEDYGVNVSVGRHFLITDGSYGKCFLAYLPEEERKYFLNENNGLRELSQHDIKLLEDDFEFIRESGYSTTYGEYIKGICGIAAPIFNSHKEVEMVIALFGLTAQLSRNDLHSLGGLVKEKANEITLKLNGI
ncbi:IclR family transcriptional regulator [Oceanobacillus senegalensis]|uniref:IclR family transcriptional regulator n=1 Tax=Oceanobacillus senegalensis TaxID=1936063 RepID=UPI0015C43BB6|nr:IclR family transcriptional regulator [Oceanobacillus senegalensis]